LLLVAAETILTRCDRQTAIRAAAENARPVCGSFFMCGTPMETKAGTAGLASRSRACGVRRAFSYRIRAHRGYVLL
jgi:hypothetical protein